MFLHLALRHCTHWAAATGLQRALEKKHILGSDLWVACASLVYFIENDNFLCPCKHTDAAFYICTNWLVASVFCFAFSSIKKRNKSKVSRSGAFSAECKFHSCFLLVSCLCSSFGVAQNCKERVLLFTGAADDIINDMSGFCSWVLYVMPAAIMFTTSGLAQESGYILACWEYIFFLRTRHKRFTLKRQTKS